MSSLLGVDRHNRRFTRPTPESIERERQQAQERKALLAELSQPERLAERRLKMQEETSKALVQVNGGVPATYEEAYEIAQMIYGSTGVNAALMKATAILAQTLGLSINPALGHIHLFEGTPKSVNGRWEKTYIASIGIYGLIVMARRAHRFIVRDPRPMTQEERERFRLEPGDAGAMAGIIDMREVDELMPLIKMTGANFDQALETLTHWYDARWIKAIKKKDGSTREDNVWQGGSPQATANKRALAKAIKNLGLDGEIAKLPKLDGVVFDHTVGGYVLAEDAGNLSIEAGDDENAIEADFETMLQEQVASEAKREVVETQAVVVDPIAPAEVAIDENGDDVLVEAVEAAKAEVSTTEADQTPTPAKSPVIAPESHSSERPYAPETLIARLQAITEQYSAEPGGNDLIDGTIPGSAKQFAREVQDVFIAAGLGQRIDNRRKRFMVAVWGVETSYAVTVAMRKAFQKWVSNKGMAQQELNAYVNWSERPIDQKLEPAA